MPFRHLLSPQVYPFEPTESGFNFQPGGSETNTCVTRKARGRQYLFFPERFWGQRALQHEHTHVYKNLFRCALLSVGSHPKPSVSQSKGITSAQLEHGTSKEGTWGHCGDAGAQSVPTATPSCCLSPRLQEGHCQTLASQAQPAHDLTPHFQAHISVLLRCTAVYRCYGKGERKIKYRYPN